MVFKLIVLALACLSYVSADEPESIVGGIDAVDHEFPYVVSIRVNGRHWCGGAIISNQHVLTAAHCVVDLANDDSKHVTIVTGSNYLAYGGETHEVAMYFYHPLFRMNPPPTGINWVHDIGMIKLSVPMIFNAFQSPINLPTGDTPALNIAVVSAWGAMAFPPKGVSQQLQKMNLIIVPTETCRQYFHFVDIIISNLQICTFKAKDMGTCSGDSGSPLAHNNEVIGVVSGGIPCAQGIPDIFTNVHEYLDYINTWLSF